MTTVNIYDDTLFQVIIYLFVPGVLFLIAMLRNSVIMDVLALLSSSIFVSLLVPYGAEYAIVLLLAIWASGIKLLNDSLSVKGEL